MCTVSMIGDFYSDKWKPVFDLNIPPSRKEFEDLKKEVEDMKNLLLRAKAYDEKHNEPHCEMEDKIALLKKIAQLVGVDLSEVFGK